MNRYAILALMVACGWSQTADAQYVYGYNSPYGAYRAYNSPGVVIQAGGFTYASGFNNGYSNFNRGYNYGNYGYNNYNRGYNYGNYGNYNRGYSNYGNYGNYGNNYYGGRGYRR